MRQAVQQKPQKAATHSLTESEAAVIKGMLERGDKQHDIAARFGVNGGRIAEIAKKTRFADVPASTSALPPPGPVCPTELQDLIELTLLINHLEERIGSGRVRRHLRSYLEESEAGVE